MASVSRRSLPCARRALLALALASALLLASLLMLRDEGGAFLSPNSAFKRAPKALKRALIARLPDDAPRAFRDGFTVAESAPRRTESDGSAVAMGTTTTTVPELQVAIAADEQGGTTTIKTQDGHEITIRHPEGKKQVTTISRDEGGKITIENVAADDEDEAERHAEEEGEEEQGDDGVKVTQLTRKGEVSAVEGEGDAR